MNKQYTPFDEQDDAAFAQIVADAFASDAEIHVFSERYRKRKQKLLRKVEGGTIRMTQKKKIIAVVAAAAALVAIPTSVYAGSQIWSASMNQTANYQRELQVNLGETDEHAVVPLDTSIYTMEIGWMPEDMPIEENGKNCESPYFRDYGRHDIDEWRSVEFWLMELDNDSHTYTKTINHVVSEEQYDMDDRLAYISDLGDGRIEINVVFKNTKYICHALAMYGGCDGFTQEELKKIVENLSLVPSDTEVAGSYSGYLKEQERIRLELEEAEDVPEENLHSDLSVSVEDGKNAVFAELGQPYKTFSFGSNVMVRVDSVTIQDNFDGINTEGIGLDYGFDKYKNPDGTVMDNVRTWYTKGDGVNTIDEEVSSETMPVKVVVVNLTYENIGTESSDVCVCPYMVWLDENGNGFSHYGLTYGTEQDDMIFRDSLASLTSDGMHFSFQTEHGNTKNNISDLQPGESTSVQLAFLVPEEDLHETCIALDYLDGSGVRLPAIIDIDKLAQS